MAQATLIDLKGEEIEYDNQISTDITVKDDSYLQTKPLPQPLNPNSIPGFDTVDNFVFLQRVGSMFAKSTIVPKEYQGNISNCCIAINIAVRLKIDPLLVFENLYIVHARPSWKSTFLLTLLEISPKFSKIRYNFQGIENTDEWGCFISAIHTETNETINGPLVTIKMAKDESWYGRSGSKWKTMPELMLRYRAISFFVRTQAPEITCGISYTDHEVEDFMPVKS